MNSPLVKNQHGLKRSVLSQEAITNHCNPLSKKPSLGKKTSNQSQTPTNTNQIRFETPQKPNLEASTINFYHPNSHDAKYQELSIQIKKIQIHLERHDKKITILENTKANNVDLTNQKEMTDRITNKLFLDTKEEITKKIEEKYHTQYARLKENFSTILQVDDYKRKMEQKISEIKGEISGIEEKIKREIKQYKNDDKWSQEISLTKKWIESEVQMLERKLQIYRKGEQMSQSTYSNSSNSLGSSRIFLGSPILLKHESHFSLHNPQTKVDIELESESMIYKIDHEGYLLDDLNHYLVDKNNQFLRLTPDQIEYLERNKILK